MEVIIKVNEESMSILRYVDDTFLVGSIDNLQLFLNKQRLGIEQVLFQSTNTTKLMVFDRGRDKVIMNFESHKIHQVNEFKYQMI